MGPAAATIAVVPTDPLPRRRRRLLHIARRYVPMVGGIERYVLDVAVAQARRGDDVRVMTLRRDVLGVVDADLDEREVIDGVAVTRLPGIGNQRSAVCLRPDRLALAIRSSDAVHLHDLRFMVGFVAIVARLTDRPLLFHTHGLLAHTTFASRPEADPATRLLRTDAAAGAGGRHRQQRPRSRDAARRRARPRPADHHAPERGRPATVSRHRATARPGHDPGHRPGRRAQGHRPAPARAGGRHPACGRRPPVARHRRDRGRRGACPARCARRSSSASATRAFHGGFTEEEQADVPIDRGVADLPEPGGGLRPGPPRGDGRRRDPGPGQRHPAASRPAGGDRARRRWSTSTTPRRRRTRSRRCLTRPSRRVDRRSARVCATPRGHTGSTGSSTRSRRSTPRSTTLSGPASAADRTAGGAPTRQTFRPDGIRPVRDHLAIGLAGAAGRHSVDPGGTGLRPHASDHEIAHPSRGGAAKPRDSRSQPGCRMERLIDVLGWFPLGR